MLLASGISCGVLRVFLRLLLRSTLTISDRRFARAEVRVRLSQALVFGEQPLVLDVQLFILRAQFLVTLLQPFRSKVLLARAVAARDDVGLARIEVAGALRFVALLRCLLGFTLRFRGFGLGAVLEALRLGFGVGLDGLCCGLCIVERLL